MRYGAALLSDHSDKGSQRSDNESDTTISQLSSNDDISKDILIVKDNYDLALNLDLEFES